MKCSQTFLNRITKYGYNILVVIANKTLMRQCFMAISQKEIIPLAISAFKIEERRGINGLIIEFKI